MSVYGICFDNGMSGKCNIECEEYLNGNCENKEEVYSNLPFEVKLDLILQNLSTV